MHALPHMVTIERLIDEAGLTAREAEFLGVLIEGRGLSVGYQKLAQDLGWDVPADATSDDPALGNLRVLAYRVRSKLERAGYGRFGVQSRPAPERGYRLSPEMLRRLHIEGPCPTCGRAA